MMKQWLRIFVLILLCLSFPLRAQVGPSRESSLKNAVLEFTKAETLSAKALWLRLIALIAKDVPNDTQHKIKWGRIRTLVESAPRSLLHPDELKPLEAELLTIATLLNEDSPPPIQTMPDNRQTAPGHDSPFHRPDSRRAVNFGEEPEKFRETYEYIQKELALGDMHKESSQAAKREFVDRVKSLRSFNPESISEALTELLRELPKDIVEKKLIGENALALNRAVLEIVKAFWAHQQGRPFEIPTKYVQEALEFLPRLAFSSKGLVEADRKKMMEFLHKVLSQWLGPIDDSKLSDQGSTQLLLDVYDRTTRPSASLNHLDSAVRLQHLLGGEHFDRLVQEGKLRVTPLERDALRALHLKEGEELGESAIKALDHNLGLVQPELKERILEAMGRDAERRRVPQTDPMLFEEWLSNLDLKLNDPQKRILLRILEALKTEGPPVEGMPSQKWLEHASLLVDIHDTLGPIVSLGDMIKPLGLKPSETTSLYRLQNAKNATLRKLFSSDWDHEEKVPARRIVAPKRVDFQQAKALAEIYGEAFPDAVEFVSEIYDPKGDVEGALAGLLARRGPRDTERIIAHLEDQVLAHPKQRDFYKKLIQAALISLETMSDGKQEKSWFISPQEALFEKKKLVEQLRLKRREHEARVELINRIVPVARNGIPYIKKHSGTLVAEEAWRTAYQAMAAKDYDLAARSVFLVSTLMQPESRIMGPFLGLAKSGEVRTLTFDELKERLIKLHAKMEFSPEFVTSLRGLSAYVLPDSLRSRRIVEERVQEEVLLFK